MRLAIVCAVWVACGCGASAMEPRPDASSDANTPDTSADTRVRDTAGDSDLRDGSTTANETAAADGAVLCSDFTEAAPSPNTPPTGIACNACRPRGPGNVVGGACQNDSDCVDGINGRCLRQGNAGIACSYDTCRSDSDCTANSICACGGTDQVSADHCIPAGCTSNADCGGRVCAPTWGSCGSLRGFVGYECHTANDSCATDADCATGFCAFSAALRLWSCSTAPCAG